MMNDPEIGAASLQMRHKEHHIRRMIEKVRQTTPVQLRCGIVDRSLPRREPT
ncbi:hypothetical protein D9M68_824710 [compost metagenome]